MNGIIKFILVDIFKNKIILAYTAILTLFAWSVFGLEDSGNKAMLTLLNVILLVVPLVSVLFSTIYIYNSSEFIELLLSQPVQRKKIWISLFGGLAGSLILAYLIAVALPLLLFTETTQALMMISLGALVSIIFTALAFLAAILARDKAKGIGISIMLWLYFALLFDGLVLFLLFQFADYPIEKPMVFLSATSPLDLARILMLLRLDSSAMMGYTGAIFKQSFGTNLGLIIAFVLLILWAVVPFLISLRIFKKKDL